MHALAALWAAAQACVSADAGRALGSSTGLALLFGDVCARFQAAEEGHVRRRLNLVAELLIGLATHAGWSLRQRVEEVAVVSQARSQSVGSESGPAFRVLVLALVDQAAAVPTQKVGAGRVQDPNTPSAGGASPLPGWVVLHSITNDPAVDSKMPDFPACRTRPGALWTFT